MPTRFRPLLALVLLGAGLVPTGPARAAAYYLGEVTARGLARGGANVVNPGDPSAVWLNPAAISLSHGVQLQLNGTAVFLPASYTRTCGPKNWCGPRSSSFRYGSDSYVVTETRPPANDDDNFSPNTPAPDTLGKFQDPSRFDDEHAVQNQALVQPIPQLFATLNLDSFGLPGLAIGGGVWAPNAGDYAFPENETTRYTLINRDLYEVFYGGTIAYRFGRWLALGAGVQGVTSGLVQTVKLSGDLYGNENPDNDLTVEINAFQHFIPSANFGVWSNPFDGLELGASVQLGRQVNATGSLNVIPGPGIQQLQEDGLLDLTIDDDASATVNFTLPPFYRVGAKYGRDQLFGFVGFDVELDFVYEQWSTFDRARISSQGVNFAIGGGEPAPLEPIVQPKNYRDSWSLRSGGSLWVWDRFLEVHGGVFYETAAIPDETFSVDLLNGQKVGLGLGASFEYWGVQLNAGYSFMAPFTLTPEGPFLGRIIGDESQVHVENPASLGGEVRTRVAMGRYEFQYHLFTVSLNIAFDEMFGFGSAEAPWNKPLLPFL